MGYITLTAGSVIGIIFGMILAYFFFRRTDVDATRMTDLQSSLETERMEKNKLMGENRQIEGLKGEMRALNKELEAANRKIAKYEEEQTRREKELERSLTKIEKAQEALTTERERIILELKERRAREEEKRDRLWAEHENNVIARLTSLCKLPQLSFTHFTNTSLPDDFDGSVKPDFMIGFLDQYIIFDAKVSKAESLQTYIGNAVKSTAQKAKKNPKIASMIFLVVPTEAIAELKAFVYPIDGYTIYIVSPEALAPILASLKRITTYEFADQMDPQQRENLIQAFAAMDFHINLQNAANILLTQHGIKVLEHLEQTDPEIAAEVAIKKQPMNAKASLSASELKKLVASASTQKLESHQFISPKTPIQRKDLETAEHVILESI